MEHRELRQLIAARALDALDPEESALVDEHVETCDECALELDALRDLLAASGLDPEHEWNTSTS